MVAEFSKQYPSNVRETIAWLLRLGRPPLPECPIEAAKQGKEPKQPCFLDGKYLKLVNWKQWQNTQPIQEIIDAWFANPKTGIGTLGGWNGKHWLGWVDFDQKDFASPSECDARVAEWVEQYPVMADAPMFRTPSGGYRFLIAFSREPENFKANSGFSLQPDGSHHVGELLTKNGGHTLLPPTVGVSGKPYQWERFCEYPPIVSQPKDVGLYPVQKRTELKPVVSLPANQGNSSNNTDNSLANFLELEIYPRLSDDVAFCWSGHDFKASGDKLRGNCPWHDSQSGTAFYVDKKDGTYLWRCPACSIGGGVIEYRHRLAGGNGEPRGRDFVDIVRQLAGDVGVSMPISGQRERTNPTGSGSGKRGSSGGSGTPPTVTAVSLCERVLEILNRNHSASERKAAFIDLAGSTGRQLREVEQLAEAIESEVDLTEGRDDRALELNALLKIGDRRLTLSRYLHPYLAQPLEHLAGWMGVDIEALLTVLLPTAASLLHPEARVIVKECSDFVEPLVFYTGIVSESGNRKSPTFKAITKALWKLQEGEDACWKLAQEKYKADLLDWKRDKSEDRGDPPEQPDPPREYFVDNITSEALDRIKAQQPEHGVLIRKDELSGLFGSYNSYRGGKGSDKEGVLSGWNGGGVKLNRAGGSRLSLSHDASSIVGAIQPDKLCKTMGDLEDSQGEWGRFLWYFMPLRAHRLPDDDSHFEVGELLEAIYRQLDELDPIQYRFTPEAQRAYQDWHWALEQKKLAEPRQGMRAAIAKMQGYTARLAGILHILWRTAAGEVPDQYIPVERVKAAKALAEFYLGQVRLIHSDAQAHTGELTPILETILKKARQIGELPTRIAKNSIKALKTVKTDKILEHFRELAAMGLAVLKGKVLIPKNVDPDVDPDVDRSDQNVDQVDQNVDHVDQNVDQMLTTPVGAESLINASLQPLANKNVGHVDHVDHISEQDSTPQEGEQILLDSGQQSQQVNIWDESLIESGVDHVDQLSTFGSTRSTFFKPEVQAEFEQAELGESQAAIAPDQPHQLASALAPQPNSTQTQESASASAAKFPQDSQLIDKAVTPQIGDTVLTPNGQLGVVEIIYPSGEIGVVFDNGRVFSMYKPSVLSVVNTDSEIAPLQQSPAPATTGFKVGDEVSLADINMVAYIYHGTVEEVVGDNILVRWAERTGKPFEYERYDTSELIRLE